MICNPNSKQRPRYSNGLFALPSNMHKIHTGQTYWTPLTTYCERFIHYSHESVDLLRYSNQSFQSFLIFKYVAKILLKWNKKYCSREDTSFCGDWQ
jgi:hypothetical protein